MVNEAGGESIHRTPKNHSQRSVPFPPFLTDMLERRSLCKPRGDFAFTAPMDGKLSNRNERHRNFERGMAGLVEAHPQLTPLRPL